MNLEEPINAGNLILSHNDIRGKRMVDDQVAYQQTYIKEQNERDEIQNRETIAQR